MNKAKVLWFNEQKGYGYCVEEASNEKIFIHYSAIESNDDFKTLKDNQSIYFEATERNGMLCADKIYPIKPKKKGQRKQTRINSNSHSI